MTQYRVVVYEKICQCQESKVVLVDNRVLCAVCGLMYVAVMKLVTMQESE